MTLTREWRWMSGLGLCAFALLNSGTARAQLIESYFPQAVPGFDKQLGVTVLSRLRPQYEQPGVKLGAFTINANLDENVGYDSNVTGTNQAVSSGFAETNATVAATSNWTRNRLGAVASVDNYTYFSAAQQNYTNYTAGLGGGYTIGSHDLNVGYTYFQLHQLGTDIGSVATTQPIPYNVNDVRADYTIDAGRFSFTPNLDARIFQFGDAVVAGVPVSQQYLNRTVVSGGVTTRFSLSDQRSILTVLQGFNSNYLQPGTGPSNNSNSVLALTGLDYQASGLWRYRLLGGIEVRAFQAAQYGTRAAPIVEGSVIYTPTELMTVTGTVRREIEDPQSAGTAGFTYSNAGLVVDYELRRNVLLQGRGIFQAAQFLQGGGTNISYGGGAGVNWLVNRYLRVTANYDYSRQNASNGSGTTSTALQGPDTLVSGSYSRSVFLLGLHFAL